MADPGLSEWWSRRRDVLAAWAKRGPTPRLTVEFVDGEGRPDASVADATRRLVMTGLALNASGAAFETALEAPMEVRASENGGVSADDASRPRRALGLLVVKALRARPALELR